MGGGKKNPRQTGVAQTPAQRLLSDLFINAVAGQFGLPRFGGRGSFVIPRGSPVSPVGGLPAGGAEFTHPLARRETAGAATAAFNKPSPGPGTFAEFVRGFQFPGPFVTPPTEIQRLAVGAGTSALRELEPTFAGLREMALTGGGLDPAGLRELERQAANLRAGFGLRGTRLSRGAGIAESELRGEALSRLAGQALERRLRASELAATLPLQAAAGAFGLGEAMRSIADQEILRRLSEFGNVRSQLFGAIGGTPIIGPAPMDQFLGNVTQAAAAAALLKKLIG